MFTEWTDSKNPGKSNRANDAALVPGRLQEILIVFRKVLLD